MGNSDEDGGEHPRFEIHLVDGEMNVGWEEGRVRSRQR